MNRILTMFAALAACGSMAVAGPGKLLAKHGLDPDAMEPGDTVVSEIVYFDVPDEAGNLSGGMVELVHDVSPVVPRAGVRGVRSLRSGGDPANRVDIVVVGDGYQEAELALFATHAQDSMADFFAEPPFDTYQNYFNVYFIEVVSADSGVDNDPVEGIERDTAMDMGFWCNGIERLLCVNVSLAYSYADAAPDADLVLAVANSTKYGGGGYSASDLATVPGGNSAAAEVAIHEFGHSLGNLADEYTYGGPATYTGPEPAAPNVSKRDAAEMAATGTKWSEWLGVNDPRFDGLHDTYEGANYSQFGIYRPTNNSMMRSLGRPFNLPSVQSLIIEIYKTVDPIDAASIPDGQTLDGSEVVSITPMQPVGHDLEVRWLLDGETIPGATGSALDLSEIDGVHERVLGVEVFDPTPLVRHTYAQESFMTGRREWPVDVPGCEADADASGVVSVNDLSYVIFRLGAEGQPGEVDGDVVPNGIVNAEDVSFVIFRLGQGC